MSVTVIHDKKRRFIADHKNFFCNEDFRIFNFYKVKKKYIYKNNKIFFNLK